MTPPPLPATARHELRRAQGPKPSRLWPAIMVSLVLALVSLVLAMVSMVLALVSLVLALVTMVLALVSLVLALVSIVLAVIPVAGQASWLCEHSASAH